MWTGSNPQDQISVSQCLTATVNRYLAVTDLLAVCEADDLVSVTSSRLISSNLDIICPSGIHAKAEGADTTRLFCKSLEFRSRVKNKAGDGLTVLLFVNTSHEKTKTISTSHCFQPNL